MSYRKIVGSVAMAALSSCSSPSESPGRASAALATTDHPAAQEAAVVASQRQARVLTSSQVDAIVLEIMNQQYGGLRGKDGKCWIFKYRSDGLDTDYCMQPGTPELAGPSGRTLYLSASNRTDVEDGFDATTPGLMGAFQVVVEQDGHWHYVAKSPALPFGTMGYCGCDKAKFVQLGYDYYGWMFTSGGTWQGIRVSNHEIVAPRQGAFQDVSDVPQIREGDQDAVYSIEVGPEPSQGGVRPLRIIKVISGKVEDERFVAFDNSRWEYRMPERF